MKYNLFSPTGGLVISLSASRFARVPAARYEILRWYAGSKNILSIIYHN